MRSGGAGAEAEASPEAEAEPEAKGRAAMAAAWGRLGALSGAAAMAGAAYGAHGAGCARSDRDEYQKELYETANRFHLLHSLALLATPHCRHPHLAGSLLLAGLGLFCGPFYFHGLTGDPKLNRGAPVGGVLLILGWVAMAF
ncbi:LOW QUALITY PROTEIN: transmembrane protein 256 [Manacus candei]|uniref:LOW QUALITY PROTEIN: transmembrane protein 256 n=1 Tax=Manacus candei TaxID=415023 RepID=UPI002226AEB2|nr:LOW QUALITY PROTEIN: transmembrane protein 256 [Manacus candei]